MKVCFTSQRAFADGPAINPFPESDPANIAYALGGTYFSFYTLRNQTDRRLAELFAPYDLVIAELNVESVMLAERIIRLCAGRVATYSEGYIGEYQRLSPTMQAHFVSALRSATINFVYWEKYVPFYRALADRPIEYLPYPYLLDQARRFYVPLNQRPLMMALPSGLASLTRNGLASLTVVKHLLDTGLVNRVACWLEPGYFQEDCQAICSVLFSANVPESSVTINWREWLRMSGIDYRPLLRLYARLRSRAMASPSVPLANTEKISFHCRTGWLNYLAALAKTRLLIEMNNRETVGRNAMDCAALEIPCISTNRSDLTAKLFPRTTLSDPWDIGAAVELCQHLVTDEIFYGDVVTYAATVIKEFDLDAFRDRFRSLVAKYRIVSD
jgi:hypothetical protein